MEKKINIGKLGENIACRFLEERGFLIIEKNYRRSFGEIDIIAKSKRNSNKMTKFWSNRYNTVHFIEVKSVQSDFMVTHETDTLFHPLDNMHPRKIERLKRAIESYKLKDVSYETNKRKNEEDYDWQFDVIAVWVDVENKKSKIKFIENIVI